MATSGELANTEWEWRQALSPNDHTDEAKVRVFTRAAVISRLTQNELTIIWISTINHLNLKKDKHLMVSASEM